MDKLWNSLENPLKKYRPHPFWSWNDRLEKETCFFEIDQMEQAGMGGFFMHARTGLETEYLSDNWMEISKACIEYAEKKGMRAWGYDEDGWPSGFAGGEVQKEYPESVIQWLEIRPYSCISDPEKIMEKFHIAASDRCVSEQEERTPEEDWAVVLCSNAGYVDLLNEKTTQTFIRLTHEKYKDCFPDGTWNKLCGFFTDEPQYRREKIPYSPVLEEAFQDRYGYELRSSLPALFFDIPGAEAVRYDFYHLVSELFVQNFTKQLYSWLGEKGKGFTGHLLHEESLLCQMQGTAGVMPHYQYMSIPGMDWLGRSVGTPLVPRQVSSVAAQTGKKQVLSETFALCGWNVSFEELKWIAHWQIVNGVTMICQHLEGYTLRGMRKRDYPPSLFYQQPYWEQYKMLNDYFGRLGQLFSDSESTENICVLHPIRSAWISYNGRGNEKITKLDDDLEELGIILADYHMPYHYADEGMLTHAYVTDEGMLCIGKCKYQYVILPTLYSIDESTVQLLEQFAEKNGKIFFFGGLPQQLCGRPDAFLQERLRKIAERMDIDLLKTQMFAENPYYISITDGRGKEIPNVHVMCKKNRERVIYFIANLSKTERHTARIRMHHVSHLEQWDLWEYRRTKIDTADNGDSVEFLLNLYEMEAAVLIAEQKETVIHPADNLDIERMDANSITLDVAEYRVNGGEWKNRKAVIRIMQELLKEQKTVEIDMKFRCQVEGDAGKLLPVSLVMETPEKYEICINGRKIEFCDAGFWKDTSFRKTEVGGLLVQGENEIVLHTSFYQSRHVYDVLFGQDVMETERNKMTYDTELENIYLCGNFGVYNKAGVCAADHDAYVTEGDFCIGILPKNLRKGDFSRQGLQFFAGNIVLKQVVNVGKKHTGRYILRFDRKPRCAVLVVSVNGKEIKTFTGGSLSMEITEELHDGENEILYQMCGTNRNLLGPHHFIGGESHSVGPDTFGDMGGWTEPKELQGQNIWSDSYCFVEFGF